MKALFTFLFLITILVFVHEFGHFYFARLFKVKVLRFSIGFGKVLFKKVDKKGTEWAFSMIPLGGYVSMLDSSCKEQQQFNQDDFFESKKRWQKMLIVLAGPFANFVFAIFAYFVIFTSPMQVLKPIVANTVEYSIAYKSQIPLGFEFTKVENDKVSDFDELLNALLKRIGQKRVKVSGETENQAVSFSLDLTNWNFESNESPLKALGIQTPSPKILGVIAHISKNSVASQVNLKEGDEILTINNQKFNWKLLTDTISTGKEIDLQIKRDKNILDLKITPKFENNRYIVGITPEVERLPKDYFRIKEYSIFEAFVQGFYKTYDTIESVLLFLWNFITGKMSLTHLGGPIAIAQGSAMSFSLGLNYYLSFMALISINLGVINLLPLMPLDGGRFVVFTLEGILRKEIKQKYIAIFQQIGMILVLILMIIGIFNDFMRF